MNSLRDAARAARWWFTRNRAARSDAKGDRAVEPTRQIVYLGEHTGLTRTVFGHKILVDTRDISLAPHLLLDGYWEMWVTKVFNEIVKPGMNVVEVGACFGYFTLLACAAVGQQGRVWAFEANPATADLLHRTLAINGFLDRATVINKAVADRTGSIEFFCRERFQGSSACLGPSQAQLLEEGDRVQAVTVPCTTLDEALGKDGPRVDLVKIDAEGSEPLIFEGMAGLLFRNPRVQIISEFSPHMMRDIGRDPAAFVDRLLESGYKIRILSPHEGLVPIARDVLLATPHCDIHLSRA